MSDVRAYPHVPCRGVWSSAPMTGVSGPGCVDIRSNGPPLGGAVCVENGLRWTLETGTAERRHTGTADRTHSSEKTRQKRLELTLQVRGDRRV